MNYLRNNRRAICGDEQPGNHTRFLVAEDRWEDKLTILHWNEQLATREGVQVGCSNHVEELVIHWITTGHRESLERLLTESPKSLQVMLDALQEALQMESRDSAALISGLAEAPEPEACKFSLKP